METYILPLRLQPNKDKTCHNLPNPNSKNKTQRSIRLLIKSGIKNLCRIIEQCIRSYISINA